MKRTLLWTAGALALGLTPGPARAEWLAEASIERFHWREHTAPIEVRETGPRFGIGVGYVLPRDRGVLFVARARFYGGVVDYDGALQSNPSEPAHSSIVYLGGAEGVELRYRWPDLVDAFAGFELDHWRRDLNASQKEEYRFVSARVGLEHVLSERSPFVAGVGARILISSAQTTTIVDAGGPHPVALTPGLGTTPFVNLGMRASRRLAVVGYWDGMRIGRSADVAIPPRTVVYQPRTDMSTIGLRLVYRIGGR